MPPRPAARLPIVQLLEERQLLTGEIRGAVYNDLNANGQRDGGEPGLAGWTVFIDADQTNVLRVGEISTTTDADGNYEFPTIAAGTARVAIARPDDWQQTAPSPGKLYVTRGTSALAITITELDPVTGAPIRTLISNGSSGITAGGGAVGPNVMFDVQPQNLTVAVINKMDPTTGFLVGQGRFNVATPAPATGAAYLNGKLYLGISSMDQIIVWDVATATTVGTLSVPIDIGTGITGCSDDGLLYATTGSAPPQKIFAIDPATGAVVRTLNLSFNASGGLAFVNGTLIAASGTQLVRANPLTGERLGTIPLTSGQPVAGLAGDGSAQRTVMVQDGITTNGVDFGAAQVSTAATGISRILSSIVRVHGTIPGATVQLYQRTISALTNPNPVVSAIASGTATDLAIALANDAYVAIQHEPGKLPSAFSPMYFSAPTHVPSLIATSDTGHSPYDGVTSDTTPTFTGAGDEGEAVEIFSDGVLVGAGTIQDGRYLITTSTLSPGIHDVTCHVGSSPGSSSKRVEIVSSSPTVSMSSSIFDPPSAAFTFDRSVWGSVAGAAVRLTNLTTGEIKPLGLLSTLYDNTANRATFSFAGHGVTLDDGNYEAVLLAANIADDAGNHPLEDEPISFFFLAGDANGDRTVNALDFNSLATSFGGPGGRSAGDSNFDGIINTVDFTMLAQRFNITLPAPSAPLQAATPAARFNLFGDRPIREALVEI